MNEHIRNIRKQLSENVDEKTRLNSQRFFKEKIKFYGVRVPLVNKISKESFRNIKELSKADIFKLCEKLWQSGILEESLIASNWTYTDYHLN